MTRRRQHALLERIKQGRGFDAPHCKRHDTALALHHPEHGRLMRPFGRTALRRPAPTATDIRLVHLDGLIAPEGSGILHHQLRANQVRHTPRRFVSDAQFALDLLGRDAATRAATQESISAAIHPEAREESLIGAGNVDALTPA